MELPERGDALFGVIKFEEFSDNSTKVAVHDVCPSVAMRDTMINSGMDNGILNIFEKPDRLLSK